MSKAEELTEPLYAELKELIQLMNTSYEENSLCSYNLYAKLAGSVEACINNLEETYK